ncbi:MAG: ATP-binding protein [Solirubrobacterales bacterium]
MAAAPTTELRMGLAAKAENLALVRQALAGFADGVSISERPLADLKQIATEACMNAVVHAYPGRDDGRIDVHAVANGKQVELRIRDWGVGFRPRPASADTSLRLGLPLIASVVESFAIESPEGGGTMLFARVCMHADPNPPASDMPVAPKEAEIVIDAGASAKPVIARVLAMAATRAGFSLDRMSDGVLVGDAIAAASPEEFADGRVGIEIEECGPKLCLRVGPFQDGGAGRLVDQMELPGLGVSVAQLAESVEVIQNGNGEFLAIVIAPETTG